MIGPLLVNVFDAPDEDGSPVETPGLFYLYKSDMSRGVAAKEYIDGLPSDDAQKMHVMKSSYFESYRAAFDHIDDVNAAEIRAGYPDSAATYQVEYYPSNAEATIDELLKL